MAFQTHRLHIINMHFPFTQQQLSAIVCSSAFFVLCFKKCNLKCTCIIPTARLFCHFLPAVLRFRFYNDHTVFYSRAFTGCLDRCDADSFVPVLWPARRPHVPDSPQQNLPIVNSHHLPDMIGT